MKQLAWFYDQGKICPANSSLPSLTLEDRGFRYGLHFFETIRTASPHPKNAHRGVLFFQEHWQILAREAARDHFPLPHSFKKALELFFQERVWENGLLRLFLTAGQGSPRDPITTPNLFLTWESLEPPTLSELKKGYELLTLPYNITDLNWGRKSGHYATHFFARQDALSQGAQEAICFDQQGYLLSATMANILVWFPNSVGSFYCATPSSNLSCRKGVTLEWVRKQLPLQEEKINCKKMESALAIALTNSHLGVMPVRQLDGKELPYPELAIKLATSYHQAYF